MTAPTREEVARGLRIAASESNKSLPEGGHSGVAVAFQSFGAMADYVLGLIRDETSELRTRVEALTRDRDAATARAERAVGLLTDARDELPCPGDNRYGENVRELRANIDTFLGASLSRIEET